MVATKVLLIQLCSVYMQCLFCDKTYNGKPNRIWAHLLGGDTSILKCEKVPNDVISVVRDLDEQTKKVAQDKKRKIQLDKLPNQTKVQATKPWTKRQLLLLSTPVSKQPQIPQLHECFTVVEFHFLSSKVNTASKPFWWLLNAVQVTSCLLELHCQGICCRMPWPVSTTSWPSSRCKWH